MEVHKGSLSTMKSEMTNMGASIKNLETQIAQLALAMKESSSKAFPSDTEKNPRAGKAITLRSGKELQDSTKF